MTETECIIPPTVYPEQHDWWHSGVLLDDDALEDLDAAYFFESEDQTTHEFRLCLLPLEFLPKCDPDWIKLVTTSIQDIQRVESIKQGMDELTPLSFLWIRPLVWVTGGLEFEGEAPSLVDGWHRLYVIRGRGDIDPVPTVVAHPRKPTTMSNPPTP
jgi:hypothetical protein